MEVFASAGDAWFAGGAAFEIVADAGARRASVGNRKQTRNGVGASNALLRTRAAFTFAKSAGEDALAIIAYRSRVLARALERPIVREARLESRCIDDHGALYGLLQRVDLTNDFGLAVDERFRREPRAAATGARRSAKSIHERLDTR